MKKLLLLILHHVALEKLQGLSRVKLWGKALWLLGFERERLGQTTLTQESDALNKQQKLLERYFFSKATKSDLKQLGLSRDIKSTQDRFHILACLLQCIIGLEPIKDIEQHRRVILWIDEMEDLICYPSRYHRPFLQGLHDLFDKLPDYFTILMNFTLASPDYAERNRSCGRGRIP